MLCACLFRCFSLLLNAQNLWAIALHELCLTFSLCLLWFLYHSLSPIKPNQTKTRFFSTMTPLGCTSFCFLHHSECVARLSPCVLSSLPLPFFHAPILLSCFPPLPHLSIFTAHSVPVSLSLFFPTRMWTSFNFMWIEKPQFLLCLDSTQILRVDSACSTALLLSLDKLST